MHLSAEKLFVRKNHLEMIFSYKDINLLDVVERFTSICVVPAVLRAASKIADFT